MARKIRDSQPLVYFIMGLPWFRQGNKYDIGLSVRVDVNTKTKINANDSKFALAA